MLDRATLLQSVESMVDMDPISGDTVVSSAVRGHDGVIHAPPMLRVDPLQSGHAYDDPC